MRRSVIPLVLLAALTYAVGLGRGAITDSDEAFYAESAREMVESGDWLTPHYNYEPRFQKPALYYWLVAGTYLVTGPNEIAARAWSALSGIGLVLVIAAAGRRWSSDDVGMLAGAIGATNFGYFAMARMALPDLPLTFFITLSIYAALVAMLDRERHPRRWLLIAATAAALGFLTKGPIALVIPALVVAPVVAIERRSTNIGIADVALAFALFLTLALPWYVAMWIEHGPAYLESFFLADNYERFATARFNDPRPWWFYGPVLAGGLLPWTPLTLVWLSPVARFVTRRQDIDTLDLRLLMWAALPLVFYTLSVGKQPRYVLPVLPPVALLLAGSIIERTRDWRSLDGARVRRRWSRSVVFGSALAGVFLVLLAYLILRVQILFVDVSDSLTLAASITMAVAGASVLLITLTRAWRVAPVVLAISAAITFAGLSYGVLSAPRDSAVQKMAEMVKKAHVNNAPVGTYGVFVRNLVFYSGIRQVDLITDEQLAQFAAGTPNALAVLPLDELERLEKSGRLRFDRLAQLRYFDEGRIRVGTLLEPDLDRDLRTVVLAHVQPVR